MKVWKVRPKGGGPWLIGDTLADLGRTVDSMVDDPEEFDLELVEMTETELANVGEFDGW